MLKKITTAIVSGCLALTMLPATALAKDLPFSDVEEDWYTEDVEWVFNEGIMTGYDSNDSSKIFGVGEDLTRAEFAQLLANWAGVDTDNITEDTTNMVDMADNQWYTGAANWAVENGLITGYDDGNIQKAFGPDDTVTREMAVTVFSRLAGNLGLDVYDAEDEAKVEESLGAMPDGDKVSKWAKPAVAWALDNDIISGREVNGYYFIEASDSILREEIAKIVKNTNDITEGTFKNSSLFAPSTFTVNGTVIPTVEDEKDLSNQDFSFVLKDGDTECSSTTNNGTFFNLSCKVDKLGFSKYTFVATSLNAEKWEQPSPQEIEVFVKTYVNEAGKTICEFSSSDDFNFSITKVVTSVVPEEPVEEVPSIEK